ncbi:MAG: BON domain-containing protein [Tepidisphaeraceae bacterium]
MWHLDDYLDHYRGYLDQAKEYLSSAKNYLGNTAQDYAGSAREYAKSARDYVPSFRRESAHPHLAASKHAGEGLLLGVIVGAAAMYLLDPKEGANRRKMIREKLVGGYNKAAEGASDVYNRAAKSATDAYDSAAGATKNQLHRAQGIASNMKAKLTGASGDDSSIEERVRTALGRAIGDAKGINVSVDGGMVRLSGRAEASDVDSIVKAVTAVAGVKGVEKNFDNAGGGRALSL